MNYFLGVLLLSLVPTTAPSNGVQPAPASFDRQLERFTQLAIEGKTQEAVVFLRKPGFLKAVDREGHTALFGAAVACNTDVLDQVLASSPAPALNHRDRDGATALFYAASQGRGEVVRRLVEHGADVNLPNEKGRTPLMAAVMMNHLGASRLLLSARADVNVQDKNGSTALIEAVEGGHFDMVNLLLQHGANPRLARNNGTTPLQVAQTKAQPKMVDLLRHEEDATEPAIQP
jgi:uncharacterized protein